MSKHDIKGKTVLIAGGAKNLGGLIARDLARHGAAAIAIHYNSAASQGEAAETEAAVKAISRCGFISYLYSNSREKYTIFSCVYESRKRNS